MYTLSSSAATKRLTTQNNLAELRLAQKLSVLEKERRWATSSVERDRQDTVSLLDHIRQGRFDSILDTEPNAEGCLKRKKTGKTSSRGRNRHVKSAPPCGGKRPISVIPFRSSPSRDEGVMTENTERKSSTAGNKAVLKTKGSPALKGDNFDQRMKMFLNSLPPRKTSTERYSGFFGCPPSSHRYYRSRPC